MLTLSRGKGTGGKIKSTPEDFIVREIEANGTVLREGVKYSPSDVGDANEEEGSFTRFVLQKRDWDTIHALITIGKKFGRGKKSIGYFGSKDRLSVSVQIASLYGVEPLQLMQAKVKDISINGAWKSSKGIELGKNLGNEFSTMIRECKDPDRAAEVVEELGGRMPNYFDRQRFGIRMNNADIGACIIRGDFEGAVMKFLTDTQFETNQNSVAARARLKEEMDYKAALDYFPRNLGNERMVIEYLSRYDNYANALRKIPRGLLVMFIHSVQSMVFNIALEARIKEEDFKTGRTCKKDFFGFPDIEASGAGRKGEFAVANLIGYETKPEEIDDYEREAMEKMGLATEEMKIKSMPELSMKGQRRVLLAPIKNLAFSQGPQEGSAKVDFAIPSGSYATILLSEITKAQE